MLGHTLLAPAPAVRTSLVSLSYPSQVLGLWVILGLAMLTGAVLLGLKWFEARAARKPAREALARGLSRALISSSRSRAAALRGSELAKLRGSAAGAGGGAAPAAAKQ